MGSTTGLHGQPYHSFHSGTTGTEMPGTSSLMRRSNLNLSSNTRRHSRGRSGGSRHGRSRSSYDSLERHVGPLDNMGRHVGPLDNMGRHVGPLKTLRCLQTSSLDQLPRDDVDLNTDICSGLGFSQRTIFSTQQGRDQSAVQGHARTEVINTVVSDPSVRAKDLRN